MKGKNLKRIIALLFAVLTVITCFGGCRQSGKEQANSEAYALIQITVEVIGKDGNAKSVKIKTDKKTLGDALYQAKLVTKEEHESGYYTVIDGVKADYSADGAWWCFKQNGEMTATGANQTKIKNGDKFTVEYTAS